MASLTIISLNIERSKHLDLVTALLSKQQADVVCLQEIMEEDIETMANASGSVSHFFEPMAMRPDESARPMGIGIFSRLPILRKDIQYYVGEPGVLRDSVQLDESTYNYSNRMVLSAEVEKEGVNFRIATTHFTWTPVGDQTDDFQRRDIQALFDVLETLGEFALLGDFNAARGGEIFTMFASRYKDNIPTHYTTSIDGSLHRAGALPHMVDGLFTTPTYTASNVQLMSGVSDHCAIVATITRGM